MTRGGPLALAGIAVLVLAPATFWFWPRAEGPTVNGRITTVPLQSVSNASGLALVHGPDGLRVATVDEVDEWQGGGDPPPLITLSDPQTGDAVGGQGHIAELGEVEALALRDGVFAYPYKTGAQDVVLRWGTTDIPLVGPQVIVTLDAAAKEAGPPPYFYEFEGLEWFGQRWELLAAVVRPDVRETPSSTIAVSRLWFKPDGTFERLSPLFRLEQSELYRDYAAALCVVGDDIAVVPGFRSEGVSLFDTLGNRVGYIALPTRRVEGVDYDLETERLFLVRECVGDGVECKPGVHFGAPLWIANVTRSEMGLSP